MLHGADQRVQARAALSELQIREQLNRILTSETFARSERLSAFLRYVVEETLRGNRGMLKEQVIGHDVYGRGSDYDPSTDPVVRVDARRLRDKLREYYAGIDNEPVIISMPKGSYVPTFERGSLAMPVVLPGPEPVALPAPRSYHRYRLLAPVGLAVVVIVAAAWYALRPHSTPEIRIRLLTSSTGQKSAPSLSPDGNFVVFGWSNGGPADLYVKAVDSESLRRLTETPQSEFSPAWSPDGREIAFIRGGEGVFVMSALGGGERKVADTGTRVAWTADSKSLFVRDGCAGAERTPCIYRIDLASLARRPITKAGGHGGDGAFSASPDGRTLAIVRDALRGGISDVYLVRLAGGDARRLTTQNTLVMGVDWTPDGKHLIYSVRDTFRFRLWRTPASGTGGNGEPITPPGQSAYYPSIARGTARGPIRIACSTMLEDVSHRWVDLKPSGPAKPAGTGVPWADATDGRDCGARFSPDGSQVVFSSFRTGEGSFWAANRDGSGLHPMAPTVGEAQGRALRIQEGAVGGWSPDGRHIVFDLTIDGNSDIYITDSRGAEPRRLTSDHSLDTTPAWSPDGRSIYFTSDRSGVPQIWRIPAEGGSAAQITVQGGFQPQPSRDGKEIYYVAYLAGSDRANVLKRVPEGGGRESVVVDGVSSFSWSVLPDGIYFAILEQGKDYLDRYEPATGRRTRLGVLPFRIARGFCGFMTMSPDGRALLANHVDRFETNLGLLEMAR